MNTYTPVKDAVDQALWEFHRANDGQKPAGVWMDGHTLTHFKREVRLTFNGHDLETLTDLEYEGLTVHRDFSVPVAREDGCFWFRVRKVETREEEALRYLQDAERELRSAPVFHSSASELPADMKIVVPKWVREEFIRFCHRAYLHFVDQPEPPAVDTPGLRVTFRGFEVIAREE